jgi:hypothetical protein
VLRRDILPGILALVCAGVLGLAGCARPPAAVSASFAGRDPVLRWDPSGDLHVVYVEDRQEGARILYRRLGSSPAGPFAVSPAQPAPTARRETPPTLERLPDGSLLIAYPVELPGHWKGELHVQRSADGGRSWEAPRRLHPQRDGSHSFLSSASTPSGAVFAWLDNRSGRMGLQAASTRDGRSFTQMESPDPETCQCCGTALLAGAGGELWLAYRDLESQDLRDFRVLRSRSVPPVFDSGSKVSSDGWHLQGCPETGARLAEAEDGTLWAAWFTGGGQAGVYVTSSSDGGASFKPRTLMSAPGKPGLHPEIGVLPDGRVVVLYEAVDDRRELSVFARIREAGDSGGHWGPPALIASGARYPRLLANRERAAVAVTCQGTKRVAVKEWPRGGPGPAEKTMCE